MIAIYVRVSTEEQSKKGYSLRNQIEECKKKANTTHTLEYVDDGYSGEFLERPGLTKLRQDVKEGHISKVICYDPDRLSRKLMNALIIDDEFRSKGVEVVYINGEYADSPEGKLFYSLRGAISEFEKAKITERMTSGRVRKAKEGKVVKNSGMYGYDYDKKNGMYTIKEDEARVVRYIFEQFTEKQVGMNSIAKELTNKGIKTKTGKDVWHRQVVRQILMNEAYTGNYYQNKWNTEGMLRNRYTTNPEDKISMSLRDESEWIKVEIPSIVSEEQFNQAAELLEVTRRRHTKSTEYLLSGLLRCQKCGNTMGGRRSRWWDTYKYIYSDQKNYAGAKNPGCGLYVPMEELDNAVWEFIENAMRDPEAINKINESQDISNELAQVEHLKKEIGKTKKGRERLYSLFSIEEMDIEEIKHQILGLQKKEDKLKEELEELQKRIDSIKKDVNAEKLKSIMKEYLENDYTTMEQKRKFIRSVVKQITVIDKDNIHIEFLHLA